MDFNENVFFILFMKIGSFKIYYYVGVYNLDYGIGDIVIFEGGMVIEIFKNQWVNVDVIVYFVKKMLDLILMNLVDLIVIQMIEGI